MRGFGLEISGKFWYQGRFCWHNLLAGLVAWAGGMIIVPDAGYTLYHNCRSLPRGVQSEDMAVGTIARDLLPFYLASMPSVPPH